MQPNLTEGVSRGGEAGQALIETVMTTGFLVAIATFLNKVFGPVILEAFENIAAAIASVGP